MEQFHALDSTHRRILDTTYRVLDNTQKEPFHFRCRIRFPETVALPRQLLSADAVQRGFGSYSVSLPRSMSIL